MIWSTMAWGQGSNFMPFQGTKLAVQVDEAYKFIVVTSTIACLLLIGGMIYFAIKYRRKSLSDKTGDITHNGMLEFLWSFIPFLIFMFMFGWGWYIFDQMRHPPKDAFEVHVIGKQWSWEFKYKSGRSSPNLVVPVNQPVKLIMTSTDVLHSFFVPAFRVKQDVVPGMYTSMWFTAENEGEYQVFCTEYCGAQHSGMLAKVQVLSQPEFEKWLATDPYKGLSLVDIGKKVYQEKGCFACHSLDGKNNVGPSWKGMFGSERPVDGGQKVSYDENYIRESILNPSAKVAAGFGKGVMPTFQGNIEDQQITALIELIKSIK